MECTSDVKWNGCDRWVASINYLIYTFPGNHEVNPCLLREAHLIIRKNRLSGTWGGEMLWESISRPSEGTGERAEDKAEQVVLGEKSDRPILFTPSVEERWWLSLVHSHRERIVLANNWECVEWRVREMNNRDKGTECIQKHDGNGIWGQLGHRRWKVFKKYVQQPITAVFYCIFRKCC